MSSGIKEQPVETCPMCDDSVDRYYVLYNSDGLLGSTVCGRRYGVGSSALGSIMLV